MTLPKYINQSSENFLFTSESVSEGHPDKLCDQISDAILDACLEQDPESKVGCEVCATFDTIMVFGEISTKAKVDYEKVVRDLIREVGYTSIDKGLDCEKVNIILKLKTQSPEIAKNVHVGRSIEQIGAGDQGIMFGYATNETPEAFPLSHLLATKLVQRLAYVRKNNIVPYLRPDSKTQVTLEYRKNTNDVVEPKRIHTILLCTQHNPDVDYEKMKKDLMQHVVMKVMPKNLIDENTEFLFNVAGSFVVGGPSSDAGLTGRKIIVDTYGGWGAHGGGCFSGKDATKVDRSGAYYARWVAKSLVVNGFCKRVLVQVSYSIGLVDPVSLYVNSYRTVTKGYTDEDLENIILRNFNFRVGHIIEELKLRRPIFRKTSVYGHFGREEPDFLWEHAKDLSHEKKKSGNSHRVNGYGRKTEKEL
ncbi:S-adenosylmethionine synthetase [Theileria orientalis strain Shintoku]|uniref:S-adenosylmethionine synthase n=1 Tax=Theileria orientalis strain Shintoku TaxID=869250 RepID=J4C8Z9_THEOR|nr:S-adenosylmethionine synthetase [Theileria orientalis strain Shintoku]BAM41668.1 S-adenosylmethionine synthetase [Theileria orientalis strain Shintoku]|eukprot:XP_009691969.1 S-adenosylmethionine synthetase [Theileria orientalis strain Shintoku]